MASRLSEAEEILKARYSALLKVKITGIKKTPTSSTGTSFLSMNQPVKITDKYGINMKIAISAADAAKRLRERAPLCTSPALTTAEKAAVTASDMRRAKRDDLLAQEREIERERTKVKIKLGSVKRKHHQIKTSTSTSVADLPLPDLDNSGIILAQTWDSTKSDAPLVVPLNNFPVFNRVAIYGRMPSGAQRFAFNISPSCIADETKEECIFWYHFNPRIWKGSKTIVQSAYFGKRWQKLDDEKAITGFPFDPEKPFCLEIQMSTDVFVVFVNGRF